jgi:hypothetical protein
MTRARSFGRLPTPGGGSRGGSARPSGPSYSDVRRRCSKSRTAGGRLLPAPLRLRLQPQLASVRRSRRSWTRARARRRLDRQA